MAKKDSLYKSKIFHRFAAKIVYTEKKNVKEVCPMQEAKKHYRIPVKEIHETPANGTYIPNVELKKLKLYIAAFFSILAILVVLPRKD